MPDRMALDRGRGRTAWATCGEASVEVTALQETVRQGGGRLLRQKRQRIGGAEVAKLAGEVDEFLSHDVNDDALALDPAAHEQELRGHDDAAVGLEDLRPDDDIHDPRLVLEGEEDDALRGPRPLPHEHQPGDGHAPVLETLVAMLATRDDAAPRQASTKEGAGMRLQRKPRRGVVFGHMLAGRHG